MSTLLFTPWSSVIDTVHPIDNWLFHELSFVRWKRSKFESWYKLSPVYQQIRVFVTFFFSFSFFSFFSGSCSTFCSFNVNFFGGIGKKLDDKLKIYIPCVLMRKSSSWCKVVMEDRGCGCGWWYVKFHQSPPQSTILRFLRCSRCYTCLGTNKVKTRLININECAVLSSIMCFEVWFFGKSWICILLNLKGKVIF